MADGDSKDVKIKISTEGGDQAKSTFASLIGSLGGIGGAVVVANQGLELLQKGLDALKKPVEVINDLANEATGLFKQMRSLAAVTGDTIQGAEQMQNTFALAGLSTEKLGFAMFRLSMSIEQGGKELTHMGVELTNAGGAALPTGAIFENVRAKISGMGNATERAAEAAKIFGARQARELLPVLSMSETQYERLKEKAADNEAMTKELEKAMGPLIESQADLAQKATKVRMGLAEIVAVPIVQFFTDLIAIPVVNWLDSVVGRMKAMNNIAAEAAKGQSGFGAFMAALGVRLFGEVQGLDEYAKNIETINKAQNQLDKNLAARETVKKKATTEDIKLAEEKLKAEYASGQATIKNQAAINEALSKMRTDSDVESIQEKVATNEKLIALANEHYEKERASAIALKTSQGGKLTAEEEYKLSSTRDKEIQKLTLENQKTLAVDMVKARVADAKKAADEEVKIVKDSMAQQVTVIESARKREAAIIETSLVPATQKVLGSYFSEVQSAKEASAAKIDAINQEIDAKRKLAAAAPQDLHLQRQVNDEIRGLARQRVDAEMSANDKILEARKNLVAQLRAEADKQAQTGATLEEKALASLEKRGKKRASMQDVEEEVYKMRTKASETAGSYGMGGRVNIAQLREARQLAPITGQLRDEGITGSQAIGMASQKSMADLGGQQWSAIPAQLQQAVGSYMQRLMAVEQGMSTTLDRMTSAVEALFAGFSSKFVRELEFQAARQ
jgi:hypothetical protein